jgi:hypothetical protein
MTTSQIAHELQSDRKFVPAYDAFRLGQLAAHEQDTTTFDNPFPSKTRDRARWEAGFFSVIYAAADADTTAYLGTLDDEPGYSESTQPYLW